MLEYEVVIPRDTERIIGRLLRYDQISDRHLRIAMNKSVAKIEARTRKNAPVGVNSRLRNSIASEVRSPSPGSLVGRVGSTMKREVYPVVMERGRKPGQQMPPSSALERWVRIRLGVPKKQVKSVAFLVARKIGRRGIMGRFFLRKAWFASKRQVDGYFTKALRDITKELAHGE
jgi:hypothetical protein